MFAKKRLLLISFAALLILIYVGFKVASVSIRNNNEKLNKFFMKNSSPQNVPKYNTISLPKMTGYINAIILGLDNDRIRTDTIIVANFNPQLKKANLIWIPRDTMIKVDGKTIKINEIYYIGNTEIMMSAIKEITGFNISHYGVFDFKGFRKIIDALDGVRIEVPFNMDYDDPLQNLHIHLKKGNYVLNGSQAEQFIRYRISNGNKRGYKDGDIGRIQAQHTFIKELLKQKLQIKYISKIPEVYSILKEHFETNISLNEIYAVMPSIVGMSADDVQIFDLSGEARYINGVSYFIIDTEKARELIENNFYK